MLWRKTLSSASNVDMRPCALARKPFCHGSCAQRRTPCRRRGVRRCCPAPNRAERARYKQKVLAGSVSRHHASRCNSTREAFAQRASFVIQSCPNAKRVRAQSGHAGNATAESCTNEHGAMFVYAQTVAGRAQATQRTRKTVLSARHAVPGFLRCARALPRLEAKLTPSASLASRECRPTQTRV